jgi:hypothetical protein
VTDDTSLPCSLLSGDSRSAHHVFGSTSSVSMGDYDVSFPLELSCTRIVDRRRVKLVYFVTLMDGTEILSGFICHVGGYEPGVGGDDYDEEADKEKEEEA